MSTKMLGRKIVGFTLVELLVVIAIIALLVAIVFPAISSALLRGRVTATSVDGRNIHQAVVGQSVADIYVSESSPWPDRSANSDRDGSTGAYFVYLVTGQIMNVSWSYFSPPGIRPAEREGDLVGPGDNEGHGWRIVDRAETLPDTAPFLMTRNVGDDYSSLNSSPRSEGPVIQDFEVQPFRDQGFAFVTRGGAAYALVGDDLRIKDRFDRLFVRRRAGGQEGSDLDNVVLEP